MPSKRRAVTVDSDTEADVSQTSKRARTGGENREVPVATTSRTRSRRGEDGGEDNDEPIVVDEEEDVQEDFPPNADDEKKFEEQHEELIRAKVMNQNKHLGSIADMGIIEKLELHQFMCHKYLEFTFGPQINFIIGRSGKSAVLSALTVALGGKATMTGRGSGLKSFIREGQAAAEVTVILKNQGEDAYKHDVYGDSIMITRRFTKEGSSSYKIKSKDGKVVSTKRDELSAICDHMNIQVDNPMNILTQGPQFLSASQPADKYKARLTSFHFFLRGTQLSQLSEEYSTCLENISQTQKVLKAKSEILPDLEEQLEEATGRFKEAEKARNLKHKADDLKKEMAWAHVATKEQELSEKIQDHEKLKAKIPKIEEKLREAEVSFLILAAEDEIRLAEQRITDLGDIKDLKNQAKELQETINEGRKKLSVIKDDQKEINFLKIANDKKIEEYKRKVQEEQRKVDEFSHDKRQETQRELQEAIEQYNATNAGLSVLQSQRQQAEQEIRDTRTVHDSLGGDIERQKREISDFESQLNMLAQRERNKLAPFGKNLEHVLADIGRQQWHGRSPIGPLGQYVRVRDQVWAPLMRVRIGAMMSAFAVTDTRDRKTLEAILKRHGNNPQIIISEVDLFDYSRGEPAQGFMTVLRALDISNEWVLRLLINAFSIESILIAETRKDADDRLRDLGHGVAWTSDAYTVERYRRVYASLHLRLVTYPSTEREEVAPSWHRSYDHKILGTSCSLAEISARTEEFSQILSRYTDEGMQRQESHLHQQLRTIKTARDALQDEANEALPVGVQVLQQELEAAEEEQQSLISQFKEVSLQEHAVNLEQRPLIEKHNQVKSLIRDYNGRNAELVGTMQNATEKRLSAQSDMGHWAKKLEDEQAKITAAGEVVDQVQMEFKEWSEKAQRFCERIENPRKVQDIQRQLESVQRALKEREKTQGASVEQMAIEVNKRKAALDNAKRELRTMLQLNKSLRKSIRVRLARWHEFRRHIALRCKIYFSYHLSNRGYFGKVLFDHVGGTLQLKVQTDDQAGTQGGNREKDPRSLSGGEKSFSTICLLLSLWESIGCPIRCLVVDEFDVFMDAVNRRISMRMMIDTANASDRKQYILITPQDMTNIQIGKTVRVHRMSDPERGQGLLSF
ncbi:uncharacterized protein PHACADRAFT_102496 [Phanerochaete carnosa HHB-10118-sp]|uniref:RecF/RecN/SMC N-terminal domain-containing protein n=1 Tax=Phanerochaete carnosa (strain HHB-10118-sp) TaxID=650164 RepID=K5UQ62_PHACS|nr:uncharacterized protein PHACADRAFT_102496 [Phanerochaete carnosa HHB-10118-sp]EKM51961.1 hypothetical protein PHACADRAFT_102496 [Phanerochaete carnosa HHB-10118-sp]